MPSGYRCWSASFRRKYGIQRADPRAATYADKWPVVRLDEQLALF